MLYDHYQPQFRRLCGHARTFADIADKTIFRRITELTTPSQYEALQAQLLQLCQGLEATVDLFHYQQAYGPPHSCVRDLYTDAAARLTNLAILQPAPQPPAPKQQLISKDGVVIELEDMTQTSAKNTYLGTDDTSSDKGSNS
jgi:hypothetical protein